jgi:hypothetical protein
MGRPIIPRPKKATRMLGIRRSQGGCRQVGSNRQQQSAVSNQRKLHRNERKERKEKAL